MLVELSQKLRRTSPCLFCISNLGTAGNWKQAVEDAQAALKFDPSYLPTWYRYGISLITAKLPGEAIEALETLLKLDPQ
jgi:tetratricopeptide (TPR) repeat protein